MGQPGWKYQCGRRCKRHGIECSVSSSPRLQCLGEDAVLDRSTIQLTVTSLQYEPPCQFSSTIFVHPHPTCRGTRRRTRRTSMRKKVWMSNPVSISSASEGVCLLCGAEGPTFAASTPCGRLSGLPVCAKDLFTIVVAQNRASGFAARGPVRGRAKPTSKPRTDSEEGDLASAPHNVPDHTTVPNSSAA